MQKASRLLLVAFLLLVPLIGYAQDKKKPAQDPKAAPTPKPAVEEDDVIRITTELVQSDVMVFDKDGRFVSGLGKDQFELQVDGKPEEITFFESVVAGGRSEAAAFRKTRDNKQAAPAGEESPKSEVSERGRTILFFVNDLHIEPGSLARIHKLINNFIDKQLGLNDQVAITSSSGQIGFLQQLTDNPAVLRAALDRMKYVPGTVRDNQRPRMTDYAAYLIDQLNDRPLYDYYVQETIRVMGLLPPQAESVVTSRAQTLVRQSDVLVKTALSSLINLMKSTAKLPGRKVVFFISDGFMPNFKGSDFTTVMRRVTDAAGRGGVVIYSLDSRGLSTDSTLDASESGGFDSSGILSNRAAGEHSFKQEPLNALAADTGGRAMLNSNAFDAFIGSALDESSRYYLLAWRPTNDAQRSSNFSKIKITIPSRPDLKVRVRRGYMGAPATTPQRAKTEPVATQLENTDDLGVAETSTEELRPLLALGYKPTSGENMQLTSSVQLSAHAPDGGGGKIDTGVLGAIYDSRGKAVGSFRQRVEVPRTKAQGVPLYATVNHQVDVPPGIYQVRVVAYERGTTHLNGAMEWIEIPKIKPGTFSISSIYVGEIPEGGTAQVTVNASRRFARSSRMRFTTYIQNAATPPQLFVQVKVFRGADAIITPPETKISTEKLTNFNNITYTGEFPLSSLAPGNYMLEVTINDRVANKSSSQQLKFTIY